MRSLTRRGISLVEMLLVLVLFTVFAALAQSLTASAARHTTRAYRTLATNRDATALWALMAQELAHAPSSDVTVPSPTSVEFDRRVGEGVVCASGATSATIRSSSAWLSRQPVAGRDRVWLRETTFTGNWTWRGIVSVGVANCPDGAAALALTLDAPITVVGIARVVEPVRLRSYASSGGHALGIEGRIGGASIQPFAGPLSTTAFAATHLGATLRVSLSGSHPDPTLLTLALEADP